MPKFTVTRSITLTSPIDRAYAVVRDLKTWPKWSPWIVAEPDCPLEFSPDGKSYSWDGEIIGSGSIEVVGESAPNEIRHKIRFLKPWKSEADVTFNFVEKDGGTEVTWSLQGSLPFFMLPMKGMMKAAIGMDYESGLRLLKDFCEQGKIPSHLDFAGRGSVPGFTYVGIATECPTAELGERMKADFDKLAAQDLDVSGKPFTSYTKWALTKGIAGYTCGLPVSKIPTDLPPEFLVEKHPACQTYAIKHTGPYHHLSTAWSSGVAHARAKIFSQSKKIKPFEIYENDPEATAEEKLITTVHFPVK